MKTAGLTAMLLGAALSSAAAAAVDATPLRLAPVRYTERVLANGLQVIAVPSNASPTVSIQVWYHVGSRNDPDGRSGFAHLFEHLMFKSTAHLKAEQFDRMTEDVGGSNNAFTSNDVTAYTDLVPSNHLEVLLWAEAERMSNLDVVQANFVSERSVVEEEYRQRVLASPYGRFANAIPQAAYRVHPYRRPSIGSIDDLEAAALPDVVAFHAAWYRPDNATLVVAGDFDTAQLDAWVDRYFGPIPRPARPIPPLAADEPPWPEDRSVTVTAPNVPLPAVALVWLAPPVTSPDAPALQLAAALLGTGDSSRLNQALVYRRRVASQAGFDADLRAGPGLLTATAIAADGKRPAQVGAALRAEVLRLAARPLGAAELDKVKTQVLTTALLARQTPEGLASAVAEAAVLQGGPEHVNTDLAALQAVTAEQVRDVARRYLAEAHWLRLDYVQAPSTSPGPQAPRPRPMQPRARPGPVGAATGSRP